MQGGVVGGVCLLAFLLSVGRAQELEEVKTETGENKRTEISEVEVARSPVTEISNDLNSDLNLVITETPSQNAEGRSADPSSSDYEGSSVNSQSYEAPSRKVSDLSDDGFSPKLNSSTGVQSQPSQTSLKSDIVPQVPILQSPPAAISDNGYGYSNYAPAFPYKPIQPPPEKLPTRPGFYTNYSVSYSQAPNYPQVPPGNSFYQTDSSNYPYQGPTSLQVQLQYDSETGQPYAEPLLNKPARFGANAPPSIYRTNPGQAMYQRDPYQTVPIPDPNPITSYDKYVRPYKGGSEYNPYQTIPVPDPMRASYESILVPYKEPQAAPVQGEKDAYLRKPVQKSYAKPYERSLSEEYNSVSSNVLRSQDPAYEFYQPAPNPARPPQSYSSSFSNSILRSGTDDEEEETSASLRAGDPWSSFSYNYYPYNGPPPYPSPSPDIVRPRPDIRPGIPSSDFNSKYLPSEAPPPRPGYPPGDPSALPYAYAVDQSSPVAFEDAKSRLIYPHQYIFPNKMPGGDVIQCTKENEFHHFWSKGSDCLVCICLNEYGVLSPICASCGGCDIPKKPQEVPRLPEPIQVAPATPPPLYEKDEPIPRPKPVGKPYPIYPEIGASPGPGPELTTFVVPTLPPPSPEASCKPLPSGTPFTNPLHPCQICVCRESYTNGKSDVQIQCQESPQCITPTDVTTLPPLPDHPTPVKLPMCEKFPEHVLFPHPTDVCKLCKCARSMSDTGTQEQHITCYPNPECLPKVQPVTETEGPPSPPIPVPIDHPLKSYPEPPIPIEPLKEYPPMEPVPLPEVVTVEPLPWPPVTTTVGPLTAAHPPQVPRQGPLPGPSPHESCKPYPPNHPFQHPWDECQVCLCTEVTAIGKINVEVNCYTKSSCCIVPPEGVNTGDLGSDISLPNAQPGGFTSTYKPPAMFNARPAVYEDMALPTSYGYQPNVRPGYQYELPARFPTKGPYASRGYPGPYGQYGQDVYPSPQPGYHPYAPMYQRPNYEPQLYPLREGYAPSAAANVASTKSAALRTQSDEKEDLNDSVSASDLV